MADDIDDLLDEVDQKFLQKKKTVTTEISSSHTKQSLSFENATGNRRKFNKYRSSSSKASSVNTRDDDDLSQMIDDICKVEDDDSQFIANKLETKKNKKSISKQQSLHCAKRCYQTYLSGSKTSFGLATISSQRACDQLRCTACDFRVSYYDDYQWHSRSDYIFFRNNMPDFEKIRANLVRKIGTRAYACQCSWESVTDIIPVDESKLKWVCGRHLNS